MSAAAEAERDPPPAAGALEEDLPVVSIFSPRRSVEKEEEEGMMAGADESRIEALHSLASPRRPPSGREEGPFGTTEHSAAAAAYKVVEIEDAGDAAAFASANVPSNRGLCIAFVGLTADITIRGGVWDCCVPSSKKVIACCKSSVASVGVAVTIAHPLTHSQAQRTKGGRLLLLQVGGGRRQILTGVTGVIEAGQAGSYSSSYKRLCSLHCIIALHSLSSLRAP